MTYRLWLVHPRYGRTWHHTLVDPEPAQLLRWITKLMHAGRDSAHPTCLEVEKRSA